MATTQAKFAGWRFDFDETPVVGDDKGRSRRSGVGENLILTRSSDLLDVRAGKTLLITDPGNENGPPVVVLLTSIKMGTDDYVAVNAVYLLRLKEVLNPPAESLPQELFLTSVVDKIYVHQIIEEANVLDPERFGKVVIDESNQDTTFICRKGYDTYYKTFSPELNYEDICKGMANNSQKQIEELRNMIVKPIHKERRPLPSKPEQKPEQKTQQKPKSRPSPPKSRPNPPKKEKLIKASPARSASSPAPSPASLTKRHRLKEVVISEDEFDEVPTQVVKRTKVGSPNESSAEDLNSDKGIESPRGDSVDGSDSDSELVFSSDDEFRPKTKYNANAQGKRRFITPSKKKVMGPKSVLQVEKLVEESKTGGTNDVIQTLPCRESQFTEIYFTLESSIELGTGTTLYASGPPGTGKTVTIREVVKQLHRQFKTGNIPKFEYLEINGLKILTPQSAYEILWNKVSQNRKVHATGLANELEEYFKSGRAEVPLVVLLDELDQISSSNQSILYNFFNWPTYDTSKLIVVAVANTMDLPERLLTNKTSSRLGLSRIAFPGYTHEDLIKIIHSKLSMLKQDHVSIKNDSIAYASRKVASVSGDARRALKIIKRAVEIAGDASLEGQIIVQPPHINRAINETTSSPVVNYILNLTFVGKLILVGILSKKRKSGLAENSLGDIVDEIRQIIAVSSAKDSQQFVIEGKSILDILYEDFIIRPKGFSFVLNELIEAGLLLQQNLKTERNSLVKLNVADEEITSVFKKESSLRFFASLIQQLND